MWEVAYSLDFILSIYAIFVWIILFFFPFFYGYGNSRLVSLYSFGAWLVIHSVNQAGLELMEICLSLLSKFCPAFMWIIPIITVHIFFWYIVFNKTILVHFEISSHYFRIFLEYSRLPINACSLSFKLKVLELHVFHSLYLIVNNVFCFLFFVFHHSSSKDVPRVECWLLESSKCICESKPMNKHVINTLSG